MKAVLLTFVLALAMGCVAPAPLPTATPVPFLARQLDVKIDPKEAARYLLNPSPLGKGGYSQGIIVTIDILPKQGWQVEEWVGPVFNIDGKTANIQMDSSQTVAVRLKLTTPPTATPTDTPIPPADTPIPPTATPRPTYTPLPTYTPFPTPTATPRPTYTPFPTATPRPTFTPFPTATPRPTYTPFPTLTPTPRPTPTPNASSYYDKGEAYYKSGKYLQAIDAFTTVIWLKPYHRDAYWSRGVAYFGLGQYQRALQDYDKAVEIDPDCRGIYVSRYRVYMELARAMPSLVDGLISDAKMAMLSRAAGELGKGSKAAAIKWCPSEPTGKVTAPP